MISLTRLGKNGSFFLNPDLIERIDCNVDTVVRLTNGVEYVVAESGDEIVERIVAYRASIVGRGPTVSRPVLADSDHSGDRTNDRTTGQSTGPSDDETIGNVVELPTHRSENEVSP